jgi:ATP-dependent Lon protease, bacterial type
MGEDADIEGLRRAVVDIFRRLVEASPELPDELAVAAENVPDPLRLTYFVASVVPLDVAVRQELLEMNPVRASCAGSSTCCRKSWPCASWAARSPPRPKSG